MDTQFTDFDPPDPNKTYYWDICDKATNFTLLMKLVLMVNKSPKVLNMIQQIMTREEIAKQNSLGWNALMFAVRYHRSHSSLECVKLLLSCGIDKDTLNARDYYKNTVLLLACEKNYREDYDFSYECIILLLEAGCDVNLRYSSNDTALILICKQSIHKHFIKCLQTLINYGANVNLCGYKSPLQTLISDNDINKNVLKACKTLVNHGADINYICGGYEQTTALTKLCMYNSCGKYSIKLLKYFINIGADTNFVCKLTGRTPLMWVASYLRKKSCVEFIEIIINSSSNLDIQNNNGRTALITMCDSNNIEKDKYIDLMIKSGANVDICDKSLNTALMYYLKCTQLSADNIDTLILLIKKSTNITYKNTYGRTAYDFFKMNQSSKNITEPSIEELLKGNITINNTKSARKW